MIRKAFRMTLKPDVWVEYQKRHNPIWPELQQVLKDHGVHNYSIFLDQNKQDLFAYAEIESEDQWRSIANTDVCQRWWAHMKDLMFTNDDNSPISKDLEAVFHID
jgi:L-rhamnose mutarotase